MRECSTILRTTAVISGTVSYRERMALSNQAELEVTLEDVSRQDVAATVIARQTINDTRPGADSLRIALCAGGHR